VQVPHLSDWIKDLPAYENPAVFADHYHAIGQFVDPNDVVSGRAPRPIGRKLPTAPRTPPSLLCRTPQKSLCLSRAGCLAPDGGARRRLEQYSTGCTGLRWTGRCLQVILGLFRCAGGTPPPCHLTHTHTHTHTHESLSRQRAAMAKTGAERVRANVEG
jgi:hypothetical protein